VTVGFKGSETEGIKAKRQQYEDEDEDEDEELTRTQKNILKRLATLQSQHFEAPWDQTIWN